MNTPGDEFQDNPDVAYCRRAVAALQQLERNSYARNEGKRAFTRDLHRQQNLIACLIALIIPLAVWIYALSAGQNLLHLGVDSGQLGATVVRIFGLFISTAMLFTMVYLAIRALWNSAALAGLRKRAEEPVLAKYATTRQALNTEAEEILNSPELSGERIPVKYLSTEAITLLLRYIGFGQADYIEAAVYDLDQDLERQAHGANIIPDDNPVKRMRRYLNQYWANPTQLVSDVLGGVGMTNEPIEAIETVEIIEPVEVIEAVEPVEVIEPIAAIEPEPHATRDTTDFVQDEYYEKGHLWLKIRETLVAILLWIVLLAPIFVLINSLSPQPIWEHFYHWTWPDGRELANFLVFAISISFVVILLCSIALLIRNNHYEKKVYPKKKTYNEDAMFQREAIMENLYSERFGPPGQRENIRYYQVEEAQNIDDGLIDQLFDEGHCGIH